MGRGYYPLETVIYQPNVTEKLIPSRVFPQGYFKTAPNTCLYGGKLSGNFF